MDIFYLKMMTSLLPADRKNGYRISLIILLWLFRIIREKGVGYLHLLRLLCSGLY